MRRSQFLAVAILLVPGAGLAEGWSERAGDWSERAGDWWSRNVQIHGFANSTLYTRWPDFDTDSDAAMSSWRNELNVELDVRLYSDASSQVSYFGVFRPIYDPVYEFHSDQWGDDANGGAFDPLTLGAATAPVAVQGREFPGHGACVVGEFCLGNGDVGTLFSGVSEPALVIDDVVFFGAVTAPWRQTRVAIGGNATGQTYQRYLNSAAREQSALARLQALIGGLPPPIQALLPPPQAFVDMGTMALASSLMMGDASLGLATPLNFAGGALGRIGTFDQAPFDVNRSTEELAFDCWDNAHPWCFVRDQYLQLDHEDTSVRVGRQQIVWGKTDAFRLQDVVNPIDIGYHNVFPDLEERRIPVLALDVIQGFGDVGPLQDVSAELVWVFDRFTPFQFGQCGEPYAYTLACQGRADAGAHQFFNFALAQVDEREWTIGNTEPGMRFEFRIPEPSMSFSLSFFYGHQDLPVARFTNHYSANRPNPAALLFLQGLGVGGLVEFLTGNPIGSTPWSTGFDPYGDLTQVNQLLVQAWQAAFAAPPALGGCGGLAGDALTSCANALLPLALPWTASEYVLEYPRVWTLGGSLDYQVPRLDTILRMEIAYDVGRGINNTAVFDAYDESDVFLAAIGLDRPTYIPFVNPDRTALLSAQLFVEHVMDYDDGAPGSGDGMVVYENQFVATFLHEHYWRNDSLIFRNFLAYDFEADALLLGPSLKWVINQNLSARIGLNFMSGGANRTHNIRDLCPDGTLGCLSNPATWNAGQWQTLNKNLIRASQSPWFSRQGFADRFMERRDEFWFGLTYQF